MQNKAKQKYQRDELRDRLIETGQRLPPKQSTTQLSSLPSVHYNSKGRPVANRGGLQFRPQRTASLNSALQSAKLTGLEATLSQPQITLNRKQSAYLAGASATVEDKFTKSEMEKLMIQKERMFQGIEDVQLQEEEHLKNFEDQELIFKVPSVSMKRNSSANIPNQGKDWNLGLQSQLSRFKNHQQSKMFVKNEESTFQPSSRLPTATKRPPLGAQQQSIQQTQSQANLPIIHPQFQPNNLDPYQKRASTQLLGDDLAKTTKMLVASQSQKNMTLKPAGSNKRPPSQIKMIAPSQAGQVPNSTLKGPSMLAHSHTEAFFKHQQYHQTQKVPKRVIKMMNPDSRRPSEASMKTINVFPERQPEPAPKHQTSQAEAAEEVLRQHYFIAKATKRTNHQVLEKQMSPQKHLAEGRLSALEQTQVHGASLMRLNAVWGHENKDKPQDIRKCVVKASEVAEGGVFFNVLPETEKFLQTDSNKSTDLEMMISLFMRQPQDNGYFIYLVQGDDPDNPFDLKPMIDYVRPQEKAKKSGSNAGGIQELDGDKYFTLSKKGITSYVKGRPEDYEPLQDWILARSNYRVIRSYTFFRSFRRWKILKKWRQNIIFRRREAISKALDEKLFLLDDTFGSILLRHRKNCKNMENLRIIDLKKQSMEVGRLADFKELQEEQRKKVISEVQKSSDFSRKLFEEGIESKLKALKDDIHTDRDEKDEIAENNKEQPTNDQKNIYYNPALAAIGFTGQIKYGPKSNLRKTCSRFLRFSYLMDFIATEALTNIFLSSVSETIDKLEELSLLPVDTSFNKIEGQGEIEEVLATQRSAVTQGSKGQEQAVQHKLQVQPFLEVEGHFDEVNVPNLPDTKIEIRKINTYMPPPMGFSTLTDFNPTCHLKIVEPRNVDEEEDGADDYYQEDSGQVDCRFVKHPDQLWLSTEPSGEQLKEVFHNCLLDGKQSLRTFVRWSKHPDLNKYQAVLETWDDKVCEVWEVYQGDRCQLNCDEWLLENKLYQEHDKIIDDHINQAYEKIKLFYKQYAPYLQQFWENKSCGNFEILRDENLYNPVESIKTLLQRFGHQKIIFEDVLPETKDIGMFRLNATAIRSKFSPQTKECVAILKELLPEIVRSRIEKSQEWLQEQIRELDKIPKKVDQFVKQIQTLEYIDLTYQDVKDKINLNEQIFELCVNFELIGKQERHRRFIIDTNQMITSLNKKIHQSREASSQKKESIKIRITTKVPKLNKVTDEFIEELQDPKYLDIKSDIDEILIKIDENDELCKKITQKRVDIQQYQQTLDMKEVTQFQNVEIARHSNLHTSRLWRALSEWQTMVNQWRDTEFQYIKIEYISQQSEKYQKTVLQCEKNLPKDSSAVQELKKLVMAFKDTMPVVEALSNEKLTTDHWEQIKRELEIPDFPLQKREYTLGQLIELDVARKQNEIVHISTTATQEYMLQQQMNEVQKIMNLLEFEVEKYGDKNDAYKIMNLSEIQATVDECLAKTSEISSNRYIKIHAEKIYDLHKTLLTYSEAIEEWKICQTSWIYLDNVYKNQELRQKQKEKNSGPNFDKVNTEYTKKVQAQIFTKKLVKFHLSDQKLKLIINLNREMEKIIKALEEYLEQKRIDMPRFYFLSNDELLQLLAHQQDLDEINNHINKCFDNVKSLYIGDPNNADQSQMKKTDTGMMSSNSLTSNEGEMLVLGQGIKMKKETGIETTLRQVVEEMQKSLQNQIKKCSKEQSDRQSVKKEWVLNQLCQVASVSSMIYWTEKTEEAIFDMESDPFSLQEAVKLQEQGLKSLVDLIRKPLDSIQRRTLVSLITQEVHCRDIVGELQVEGIEYTTDFKWQQQLRYSMEFVTEEIPPSQEDQKKANNTVQDDKSANEESKKTPGPNDKLKPNEEVKKTTQEEPKKVRQEQKVIVKQVNASFTYGYEYMGATTRLVITPLTDKCWLTITGALHIKLSASPSGPAGTGKTESTKDLAKAMGYFCVVYNCSDQVEYKIMERLFTGLVRTGAWACLDEFNRIEIEVLSVIAQQLQEIRQAKLRNLLEFNFCEKKMLLNQSCGVFVTMNPGYAGRTELPDNLKVLFRPVSMMIPSYQLIAEVMLFAEGFNDAKRLSTKMVKLYKLSSEQLSQQDHYDFGMRAVKSVLVMAGNLKRQNPEESENSLLIRAMRDANVPKFLSEDLPLFSALITDLFPGVELETRGISKLEQQIYQTLDDQCLVKLDAFVEKVNQLNDTLLVRFGVMIVGPTNGGKTTAYRVLQEALNSIERRESTDDVNRCIKTKVMNPKCITMGELYGQENKDTQEWTDGLASKNMRKIANTTDQRNYWIVLDGPVDALWIENLNTVLDDNMTLCLASGERVKLRTNMHLLFEVQDLAVASPATVSRCGMVYMSPHDLGWKPYYESWVSKFVCREGKQAPLLQLDQLDLLNDLFEQITEPILEKLQTLANDVQLKVTTLQMIQNACNYLEYFILNTACHPKPDDKLIWIKYINAIYGYSIIWAFGAHYKHSVNRFVDVIFRDFFSRLLIPAADSVYEYYLDESKCQFVHLKEVVPNFQYPSAESKSTFFDLVVPTIDTMRYAGHLRMLTSISKPVFITGQTGTGKSMIVQNFMIDNHAKQGFISIVLNFSAQTDSLSTQYNIEGKLEKKRKKSRGAKGTLKTLIFVDDINMPMVEEHGAQPPIELLRQLIEKGGFYDRQQLFWKEIENFTLVAAAAPPSGGRSALCPRFMRRFHIFNVPEAAEETLTSIFEQILGGFLHQKYFNERIRRNQPGVSVSAVLDLYNQITKSLLPIPAKFFYTFNMRDISKVFQGMLMSNPLTLQDNDQFAKLWLHEVSRVFGDRLINQQDRDLFRKLTLEILNQKFKASWATSLEDVWDDNGEPLFSVIMKVDSGIDEPTYDLVEDKERLVKVLQDKLIDYGKMNLVFFGDAVNYLSAIVRVLNQPKGNAMLIGVSGSGKQSLTKLATFILEQKDFQLQLSKTFKSENFRDAIKQHMLLAGCNSEAQTFILTDNQIMYESFLEDINNILNTGEITNLYTSEELAQISDAIDKSKDRQVALSKEEQYQLYIAQLQSKFHVILCMSPVGDQLRIRCRMFPSLVNCCTLVWFSPWPISALTSVAEQYLAEVGNLPKQALVDLFPLIHSSVQDKAEQFFLELRRKTYITPKSFLDAMSLYIELVKKKRFEHNEQLDRLSSGVRKLNQTNEQIENLQVTLTELQPKLVEQETNANIQAESIREKKDIASQKEIEAEQEVIIVQTKLGTIEILKSEAEQELSAAKPALLAATEAVNNLSKDDVVELKGTKNPNEATQLTMRCVLTYLGLITQSSPYEWKKATVTMADMQFLQKLKTYDKENIPQPILDKVKKIIKDTKEFDLKKIASASKAAGGLASWCKSVYAYSEAIKQVKPKEEQVATLEQDLKAANEKCDEMKAICAAINAQVKGMEAELQNTMDLISKLRQQSDTCKQRLANADKLISLLADEGKRWEQTIKLLQEQSKYIPGEVFIATAELSYLGPFNGSYRQELIRDWLQFSSESNLEISAKYSLMATLGNQVEIREWCMSSLPSDQVSIDNAIMSTNTQRWPLLIDPQQQANTWIKKMVQSKPDQKLILIKAIGGKSTETQKQFETAIRFGHTALLEEVSQEMDPSLDSLFNKATYQEHGLTMINFGDKSIEYDSNFKFYLTTKIHNPHFLPETCIKLTVINFSITFEGLSDQMLVDVIKNEAPEIEEQRDSLVIRLASSKNALYKLQSQILTELAESNADTILDNTVLIKTLEVCNKESILIGESVAEAEQVEITINETRDKYRVTAIRGSLIYFSIVELSLIDPMYQNSLVYVKQLFNEAIRSVQKNKSDEDFQDLVFRHLNAITEQLYSKICVGLFETHKLIFAFLICTRIKKHACLIDPQEWSIFYKGADLSQIQSDEQQPKWLTAAQWSECYVIPNLQTNILANNEQWHKYCVSSSAKINELPDEFQKSLTEFQKLLVTKILKQEILQNGVQQYLRDELGPQYAVSPTSSMEKLFQSGDQYVPIIFILSQGVDPTAQIINFANSQLMQERFVYKSLGQGQEKIAEEMIDRGMVEGNWVLLQNCHLFKSWMPRLETKCIELGQRKSDYETQQALLKDIPTQQPVVDQEIDELDAENMDDEVPIEVVPQIPEPNIQVDRIQPCHPDFKLILTSMPVTYFPISVLQNSLKMTTDPPKGIKANLKRTYMNTITQDLYDETLIKPVPIDPQNQTTYSGMTGLSSGGQPNAEPIDKGKLAEKQKAFKYLTFSLAFFHAVVQERRKFGPLGWNILYEFSDADLDTSITMLKNFMIDNQEIPWDSIKLMTGMINYGGRVTDFLDQVLLMSLLQIYQCEEIILTDAYRFSASGIYKCPNHETCEEAIEYIDQLPDEDLPEIFGMHKNANITYLRAKSQQLIDTICSVQPREYTKSGEGAKSSDEIVIEMAEVLQTQVPESIGTDIFAKEILRPQANGLLSCLSTVLLQELNRYNKLVSKLNSSLEELIKAVKGIVLMSQEMDIMFTALLGNQVPQNWMNISYPSLKKLSSWVSDLQARVEFMRVWAQKGHPKSYWLSGFFFPHGFITGVLQTYARKYQQPIDQLKLQFDISKWTTPDDVQQQPEDGIYVYGLYLQNAHFSVSSCELRDCRPNQMSFLMPIIHFMPKVIEQKVEDKKELGKSEVNQTETYSCPVYKTSLRAGVLSTTGQSTNYILSVDLPCVSNESSKYNSVHSDKDKYQSTVSAVAEGSVEHWTLRGTAMLTMLDD